MSCNCNGACSGSSCGGNCGQPVKIVTKQGEQGPAGVAGPAGQALKYNDVISGGSLNTASYTKLDPSITFPGDGFTSYAIPAGQLAKQGDYVIYITELTDAGDLAADRFIQVRLNEDWTYLASSPDNLTEIVFDTPLSRIRITKQLIRVTATEISVTMLVEKFDGFNALASTDQYQFLNIVLNAANLPTHGATNLDIDPLEISTWIRASGAGSQGVSHIKTRVVQYNLP